MGHALHAVIGRPAPIAQFASRWLSVHLVRLPQGIALVPLTEALHDPVSFVRVWAAAALARVEPENPDAMSALVAGTRDQISFVRSLAAWHLGRLGPRHVGIEAAVPKLRELVIDIDPSVRAEAVVALGNLEGKGAPPAELKSLSA